MILHVDAEPHWRLKQEEQRRLELLKLSKQQETKFSKLPYTYTQKIPNVPVFSLPLNQGPGISSATSFGNGNSTG
jgi:hypothetical protein